MTKLRFPSLGGGGGNHPYHAPNNGTDDDKSKQRRHVSPFRPQRKDSKKVDDTTAATAKATGRDSKSTTGNRSKTPVRWLVHASSDLVKSATTLKKTVHKPDNTVYFSGAKLPTDLGASATQSMEDDHDDPHHLSSSYLPTFGNGSPSRNKFACDPEETLSVTSSASTPGRTNVRPRPSVETFEILSSSSSPTRRTTVSFSPPDPEGLELWTTPTKSTAAASSYEDDDDDISSTSSKDSGLILFGDDEDNEKEEEEKMAKEEEENVEQDDDDDLSQTEATSQVAADTVGDTNTVDDTKTEVTFQTATANSSIQSNTAEEAAWGACADLTAPAQEGEGEDANNDAEENDEQEQQEPLHVNVDADDHGEEEEYDDFTYTPSLAPSAGFDTISPAYFGFDGSTVGGTRNDKSFAASPPKEVLAMRAASLRDRSMDNIDACIPEEENEGDHDAAAKEEEIRMAREMASNLLQELETVRGENERMVSRTRRLQTHLQELKIHQEEHMIQRSRLVKACLYISPIFILCGGLDIFCITILLVWVLVEVENYMDLGDEKAFGMPMDQDGDIFADHKEL
jgi:hypothetical protein